MDISINSEIACRSGRALAASAVRMAMEGVTLVMVCASPWVYGSVDARFESLLYAGVALLLLLWAARMLLEMRLTWHRSPVAVCLAAILMFGALQQVPLPAPVLQAVSPATKHLYDRLLPTQPEALPASGTAVPAGESGGERAGRSSSEPVPRVESGPNRGSTISLYPEATRRLLVKLLAVFFFFVVVLNNVASAAALRRLCIVAVVNGMLLALFALVQFFASPDHGTVYWSRETAGMVFGPFVNRNHFAFYVNLCIGLGIGLLFGGGRLARRRSEPNWFQSLVELLHEPRTLWISGALAIMVSSVAFSLSRGGVLALVGSAGIYLACVLLWHGRSWRVGALVLTGAVSLALLTWLGMDRVEARLATLWSGEALDDGRLELLSHSWPLIRDYWVLGTGYGTFQYVESLYLHTPRIGGKIYEHAHNDYLEAVIEGGIVRLLLSLLAIGLVARSGLLALWRGGKPSSDRAPRSATRKTSDAAMPLAAPRVPDPSLVAGALFAFTAALLHSFTEFALFMPAVAVLVTVICAYLCNLQPPNSAGEPGARNPRVLRYRGAAPIAGACLAVAMAGLLHLQGSRMTQVEQLTQAVVRIGMAGDVASLVRKQRLLDALTRLAPADATFHAELAETHYRLFQQPADAEGDSTETHAATHREAALRHFLIARDLCPLLPEPHVRLAVNTANFARSDPRAVYLERAKLLAPANAELWYICGRDELAGGRREEAWSSWRSSLELSDRFLAPILAQSATVLTPAEILHEVLPDRPRVLIAAARFLDPETAARRPFLEKALRALPEPSDRWKAEDWLLKATLHRSLNQPDEARASYQQALSLQPQQAAWRFEYAQFLHEQGRLQDSRRELLVVLGQQPEHAGARELAEAVSRQIVERSR